MLSLWLATAAIQELDVWALTKRIQSDISKMERQFGHEDSSAHWAYGTVAAAELALARKPANAELLMQAGLVWFYVGHLENISDKRNKAFSNAIAHYENAIVLRPAWPHHYRNLHDLYYLTGRNNAVRLVMLERLFRFGKWSRPLKLFLLDRTLSWRPGLTPMLLHAEGEVMQFLLGKEDPATKESMSNLRKRHPIQYMMATREVLPAR